MKKRAFTIIELLVVVGIIGLLAAAVSLSLSRQQASARDGRRKADIANLNTAIQSYLSEKIEPASTESGYTSVDTGGYDYSSQTGKKVSTSPEFMTWLVNSRFISKAPLDPINDGAGVVWEATNSGYAYGYRYYPSKLSDGNKVYYLMSKFETMNGEPLPGGDDTFHARTDWKKVIIRKN